MDNFFPRPPKFKYPPTIKYPAFGWKMISIIQKESKEQNIIEEPIKKRENRKKMLKRENKSFQETTKLEKR